MIAHVATDKTSALDVRSERKTALLTWHNFSNNDDFFFLHDNRWYKYDKKKCVKGLCEVI